MIYSKSHSYIKKQVIAQKCKGILRTHKYALFFHYNGTGIACKARKPGGIQPPESVANWQQLKEKIRALKNSESCSLKSLLLPSRLRIPLRGNTLTEELTSLQGAEQQRVCKGQENMEKRTKKTVCPKGLQSTTRNVEKIKEKQGDTEKRNGVAKQANFLPFFQGNTLLVATSSLEQMGAVLKNCSVSAMGTKQTPTFVPIGGAYDMNFCSHLDIQRWVELHKDDAQVHATLCRQFTHWQRMLVALPNHLGRVPGAPGTTVHSISGIRLVSLLYALQERMSSIHRPG